jgi:uncharacterized membrane protein YjgN (DUF898 family)
MTNVDNQLEQDAPQQFSFTGTGSEYFGIWIVNLLLSIVTLGIYSAWAKVRRNRYFYSNTHVAQASFDYQGNPIAILKGRVLAIIFFALYNIAVRSSPRYLGIMLLVMAIVMPWLIWKSIQFKLHNSSYRGIRFGFRGTAAQAYFNFLLLPVLSLFTIYLLAPFTHQRIKKFQHSESRYGATYFSFNGKVGDFYIAYLIGFAVTVAGLVAIGCVFGSGFLAFIAQAKQHKPAPGATSSFFMLIFAVYAWIFAVYPLFLTLIQNLIWNNTQLAGNSFRSNLKWGKMTFILLTNILGVICTLGLFAPFAHVRFLKYKIEAMTLVPDGSIDNFITATDQEVTATGEGVTDVFDFDLSL